MDTRRISHGNPYSDEFRRFLGTQTPQEAQEQAKREKALSDFYGFDTEGIQTAYGPEDMIAGGVAGTMLAPTKGLARFLFEAGIDPLYEAAIQNSRLDDSYLAMATGKRGIDNLINVWHRTTPEAAKSIRDSGKFTPKEDGIFFTDKIDGPASFGYGDDAVEFSIPESRLQIDDEFPDGERHFRFPAKQGKEIDISDFIVRNDSGTALSYDGGMSDKIKLFHTSNDDIQKIDNRTDRPFGSNLFFSADKQKHGGKIEYSVEVDKDKILDPKRLFYDDDIDATKVDSFVDDIVDKLGVDRDAAEDLLSQRKSLSDFYDELNERMGLDYEDVAEFDWWIQKLTGESAKALGYRGVAMPDEHGTSYLIDMLGRESELKKITDY